MSQKDYYDVLGVSKSSTAKEIKKAYKRQAMKHHPDRNVDNKAAAEEKFKEIQKAYAILSNEQKRQSYDQFGHAGVNGAQGGFSGGNPFGGGAGFDFGDIFGDIFGGHAGSSRGNIGADLEYVTTITLKESIEGSEIKLRLPKKESCNTCNGSGAKPGTTKHTCHTCNGMGEVSVQQGFFSTRTICSNCQGMGDVIEHKCTDCKGVGFKTAKETIKIDIPAGISTGQKIKIVGRGYVGADGNGDLYIEIEIEEHPFLRRDGINLHCEIPVSFATLALGGSIKVPTISTKMTLKIPEGTKSGLDFRLKGLGVPKINSSVMGDLYCKVVVEIPVNLSEKQRKILKEFDKTLEHHHNPQEKGFFEKMKSFFN